MPEFEDRGAPCGWHAFSEDRWTYGLPTRNEHFFPTIARVRAMLH